MESKINHQVFVNVTVCGKSEQRQLSASSINYYANKQLQTFDVDKFINDTYTKYAGTPQEESKEAMHQLFRKVLAMPRQGDKSLYPNDKGPHPALLEVWLKAGDFWRAGQTDPDNLICDQDDLAKLPWEIEAIQKCKAAINGTASSEPSQESSQQPSSESQQNSSTASSGSAAATQPSEQNNETSSEPNNDTPEDDNSPKQLSIFPTLFKNEAVRTIAGSAGILTAIIVLWESGLIIPFALAGAIVGGLVK